MIDNYLHDIDEAIVVRNLVTESPLLNVGTLRTVSLEKILVDIFCDIAISSFYQDKGVAHIYKNVMSEFAINMPKMMRYAKLRGKHGEIKGRTIEDLLFLTTKKVRLDQYVGYR